MLGYDKNIKSLTGLKTEYFDSSNFNNSLGDTYDTANYITASGSTTYTNFNPITNKAVSKFNYVLFPTAGSYTFDFTNTFNKYIKFYYFIIGGGGSGGSGGFYTPNYGGGGGGGGGGIPSQGLFYSNTSFTLNITVGAGGASSTQISMINPANTAGATGNDGGQSSLVINGASEYNKTVTCAGGKGGLGGNSAGNNSYIGGVGGQSAYLDAGGTAGNVATQTDGSYCSSGSGGTISSVPNTYANYGYLTVNNRLTFYDGTVDSGVNLGIGGAGGKRIASYGVYYGILTQTLYNAVVYNSVLFVPTMSNDSAVIGQNVYGQGISDANVFVVTKNLTYNNVLVTYKASTVQTPAKLTSPVYCTSANTIVSCYYSTLQAYDFVNYTGMIHDNPYITSITGNTITTAGNLFTPSTSSSQSGYINATGNLVSLSTTITDNYIISGASLSGVSTVSKIGTTYEYTTTPSLTMSTVPGQYIGIVLTTLTIVIGSSIYGNASAISIFPRFIDSNSLPYGTQTGSGGVLIVSGETNVYNVTLPPGATMTPTASKTGTLAGCIALINGSYNIVVNYGQSVSLYPQVYDFIDVNPISRNKGCYITGQGLSSRLFLIGGNTGAIGTAGTLKRFTSDQYYCFLDATTIMLPNAISAQLNNVVPGDIYVFSSSANGAQSALAFTQSKSTTTMTITVGVAGTFTPSAYIQKSILSNGSSTLTCSDTTGIVVGQFVKDTGLIPGGAQVSSFVANTSITLNVSVPSGIARTANFYTRSTNSDFNIYPSNIVKLYIGEPMSIYNAYTLTLYSPINVSYYSPSNYGTNTYNIPTQLPAIGFGGGSPGGSGGRVANSSSLAGNAGCVMIYYDTSPTNSFPVTDLNIYSNLISHSNLNLKQYLTLPSGEFSPSNDQLGYYKEVIGTGTNNITSGVGVPGTILSVLKGTYIINAKFVFNIATAGTTMSFYIGTTVSNSIEGQTQYYASTGVFTYYINTIYGSPLNVYIGMIMQNSGGSFTASGTSQRLRYTRIA
jgi:hypothetical protein